MYKCNLCPPPQVPPPVNQLLGNGEWPYECQPANALPLHDIPPPPDEAMDYSKKDPYKMTAKPRGVGK